MVMTCEQNTGRDYNVNTGNTCVEIVEYFKYVGKKSKKSKRQS